MTTRTGQALRQDDWLVGQHIRQTEPTVYEQLLTDAKTAKLTAAAERLGVAPESAPYPMTQTSQT